MHNREHVVIIRPAEGGLVLHTLYYSGELHQANKTEAPLAKFSAKELGLAKSLVPHVGALQARRISRYLWRERRAHD